MAILDQVDDDQLKQAVLVWTGYADQAFPTREDAALRGMFAPDYAEFMISLVRRLESEFYQSKACYSASSLSEMGVAAAADFSKRYPTLPGEIADAFAWCYTFDHK